MTILGIGGLLNDAACAVLKQGRLVAAVEQKKVARSVRLGELPSEAIKACLCIAGVEAGDLDCAAIAQPFTRGSEADMHLALRDAFPNAQVVVVEHHAAHAASAYYLSPFEEATVLTLDRAGDFRCGARWHAGPGGLHLDKELYHPDSLGDLYGRVTELLGFKANADEHKVQWLSASGGSEYEDVFSDILPHGQGGWPRLDRSYFHFDRRGAGGFSAKFYRRLGLEDGAEIPMDKRASVAAGLQRALERTVIAMAGSGENLCLAGGLALNVFLVAALENSARWKNVFVQPAAGNAGTAIGAALHAWHNVQGQSTRVCFDTLCLGPGFSAEEIKQVLENCKLRFRYLLTTGEVIEAAVRELQNNKIVAWMHGRTEFGPRALGNRSILASPSNPYSTENLNIYIKRRESFRKFAASVPEEVAAEYFEAGPNARFLATVGRVKPNYRKLFESAVMGDGLVRVHTVSRRENPLFWDLLKATGEATGLPVLYNTSFNLFGDPLVAAPRDAVRSFYSSGIDALFAGNFYLEK
jgi:carbamoyltransferase